MPIASTAPQPLRPGRRLPGGPLIFVVATLALSWLAWLVATLVADSPDDSPVAFALWAVGGMGPAIVAVALAAVHGAAARRALRDGLQRWRVGRWYAVLLLPLPVSVGAVLLAAAADSTRLDISGLSRWYLLPLMFLGGTIFGGIEEIGWRGYLQPRMQTDRSALAASLLIGVVWAVWHAPLFAMAGTTQATLPFGWFALQSVALSVLFGWVRNSSRSTLLVVLLHGSANASFLAAVQWLTPEGAGAALPFLALLVTAIAVVVIRTAGPDLVTHGRAEP